MGRVLSGDLRSCALQAGRENHRPAAPVFGLGIGSNSNPMERGSRLDVHKDHSENDRRPQNITLNGIVALLAKDRSVQIVRSALSIWLLARCFRF